MTINENKGFLTFPSKKITFQPIYDKLLWEKLQLCTHMYTSTQFESHIHLFNSSAENKI